MEWLELKSKIIDRYEEIEKDGYFSDKFIQSEFEKTNGEDWKNSMFHGNSDAINAYVELTRSIKKWNIAISEIQSIAKTKAQIIFSELISRHTKISKLSIQNFISEIEKDIESNNKKIRKFLYQEAESAYPENMEGIESIARERCPINNLNSKAWEEYYYFFTMLSVTFLLSDRIFLFKNFKKPWEKFQEDLKLELTLRDSYTQKLTPKTYEDYIEKGKESFQFIFVDRLTFESKYSNEQLIAVKNLLLSKDFISDTSDENFLFWFGRTNINNPVQLNWLKINTRKVIDKQAVTELIVRLCGQTNNPAINQCFGLEAPKNQPKRGQFENNFYSALNSIVPK